MREEADGERQALPVELGVEIVEQHERRSAGGRQALREACEEREDQDFAFARRRRAPGGAAVEENLDAVALRSEERLSALALLVGALRERVRDRGRAVQRARRRRLVGQPQRRQVGAEAGEKLARRGFEAQDELRPLRGAAGDERRQELVPGIEIGGPPARREQVALLGQHAMELLVLCQPRRPEEECRAVEETPADRGRTGDELPLRFAPDDDRQERQVFADGRRFLLQREVAAFAAVGDRELPEAVARDLRPDEEGLLAARRTFVEVRRAEALAGGGEIDRFEEAALAGAVGAVDELEARPGPPVGGGQGAKAGGAEALERGGLDAQMRIGMMTQR